MASRPHGRTSTALLAKTRGGALVSTAELASAAARGERALPEPSTAAGHADGHAPAAGLGQLAATSIAGNDLLSSCLYTGGICASYAGKAAPISLLLVSVMLYFFRFVYGEVVTAFPVNGGSYTALSNTTSKRVAALAACMSMISYVATAVVSAESAVQYLQLLIEPINNSAGLLVGTVGVLAVFAGLNLLGIAESAGVALVMFALHVFALLLLIVWAFVWACKDEWRVFSANLAEPYPSGATWSSALFFGYSAALLGITGFETAANYVEEIRDGRTYIATLRNMWVSVAFFNPILAALSMAVMPLDEIYKYQANLLGPVARVVGGNALETFICIDGFIVLCGSVLTAYVGIVGLVRRMALDRCLPDFLLTTNALRGTPHWIILGFLAIASSLFLLLNGDVDMLGSVYNIAFLSVMTAFAASCAILKWKRPDLPRLVVTPAPYVALALIFVVAGLIGNIARSPIVLLWFFVYFGAAAAVVFTMFNRSTILRTLLVLTRAALASRGERARARARAAALVASHKVKERATLAVTAADGGGKAARTSNDSTLVHRGVSSAAAAQPPSFGSFTPALCIEWPTQEETSGGGGDDDAPGIAESLEVPEGALPPAVQSVAEQDAAWDPRASLAIALSSIVSSPVSSSALGSGAAEGGSASPGSLQQAGDGDDGTDLRRGRRRQLRRRRCLGLLHSCGAEEEGGDGEAYTGMGGEGEASLLPSAAALSDSSSSWRSRLVASLESRIRSINQRPHVFFAKNADLDTLNKAVLYVRSNEQTEHLVIVHIADDAAPVRALQAAWTAAALSGEGERAGVPRAAALVDLASFEAALLEGLPPASDTARLLASNVALLDSIYPKLRLDFLYLRGTAFGPQAIAWVGRHLHITTNLMFMAMPDAYFPHRFAALGGLRVITRSGEGEARTARERHVRRVLLRSAQDLNVGAQSVTLGEDEGAEAGDEDEGRRSPSFDGLRGESLSPRTAAIVSSFSVRSIVLP